LPVDVKQGGDQLLELSGLDLLRLETWAFSF
jgi:hypothetical protein